MKIRVENLEERLLDEMKHDAIHLAQAQEARAEEGFFSNLRAMAGAVGQLRTEQRHAEAAAHAKKLMGTDEEGLKQDQVKANWAALRSGTAQAGILQGGFGADFTTPQQPGRPSSAGTAGDSGDSRRGSGSDNGSSRRSSVPLASSDAGAEVSTADLAAVRRHDSCTRVASAHAMFLQRCIYLYGCRACRWQWTPQNHSSRRAVQFNNQTYPVKKPQSFLCSTLKSMEPLLAFHCSHLRLITHPDALHRWRRMKNQPLLTSRDFASLARDGSSFFAWPCTSTPESISAAISLLFMPASRSTSVECSPSSGALYRCRVTKFMHQRAPCCISGSATRLHRKQPHAVSVVSCKLTSKSLRLLLAVAHQPCAVRCLRKLGCRPRLSEWKWS